MRPQTPRSAAVLGLAVAFAVLACGGSDARATDAQQRLIGYVPFTGSDKQPMGMSEAELTKFIDEDLEKKPRQLTNFKDSLWPRGLLYSTPAHTVSVGPFSMARHELTNAQWLVFLNSPRNTYEWQLPDVGTLKDVVVYAYGIDPEEAGTAYQHAWLTTYYSNEAILQPLFNPTKKKDEAKQDEAKKADEASEKRPARPDDDLRMQDTDDDAADEDEDEEGEEETAPEPEKPAKKEEPKWDPLFARADEIPIPKGTKLRLYKIAIPQVGFANNGAVQEGREKAPVNYVSWEDCLRFSLWAGVHIPTEAEWEHVARGVEGRRFAWGNDWSTTQAAFKNSGNYREPLLVDEGDGMESPEGLRHLAGNVNEWVLEPFRLYPGHSKKALEYKQAGHSVSARGGYYGASDYTMFAADRIWDAGAATGSKSRVEGWGFRPAAYAQPMKDQAVLVAMNFNDLSGQGPWKFVPPPVGLSEKAQKDPANWTRLDAKTKRQPLIGIDADRTAGWLERKIQDGSGGNHVYITGAAKGVGFIPVRGMQADAIRNAGAFTKTVADDKQICFVGVLIGTANATLQLESLGGEPVTLSFDDPRLQYREDKVGYEYPLGAFVVLRGDRVAVYAPDGSSVGTFGKHMDWGRTPIGFLPHRVAATKDKPAVPAWSHEMVEINDAGVVGDKSGDVIEMTTVIPPLTDKGAVKSGTKGVALTLHVKAKFTDR